MPERCLSIILPCFNAEKTLEAALNSIRNQSFESWEIIAVDDGSTDSTYRILKNFERRDRRIKVLRTERCGLVEALNKGVGQAQAELVARQDADDESLPLRFALQVEFLRTHPEVSVVGCMVEDVPGFPSAEGYRRYMEWTNSIITPKDHWLNRFVDAPIVHPTIVVRRSIFERFGLYRENPPWPEDFEIFLRWFQMGVTFEKVPRVLYRWRERKDRLSRTCSRYSEEAFYRCKAHYLARGPLRDFKEVGIWGAGRVSRKRASFLAVSYTHLTLPTKA